MRVKTYSEERQQILFKASRDMRRVACQVLDDVTLDAELLGDTVRWAKNLAANTAIQATELENLGWEYGTYVAPSTETWLLKSKLQYSDAITAFEARIAAAKEREGERV